MNYFEYEVEVLSYENDITTVTYYGVTYGSSYDEAAYNVTDFYGEDSIISLKLTEWEDEICLEIPEEVLRTVSSEVL